MARLIFPDNLNFTCTACGLCCRRGFEIWCPPADKERLSRIDWPKKDAGLADQELFIPTSHGYRFALTPEGACRFLDSDNKCIMHREIGFDAKILSCKMYPFNLTHSFGDVYVGMLFSCPAVVDNSGAPVASQKRLVENLNRELEKLLAVPAFSEKAPFDGNRDIALRSLRFLGEETVKALTTDDLSLPRRIMFASKLADLMAAATDEQISARNFHDTLCHYRTKAADHAANSGLSRGAVKGFEGVLLRQLQGMISSMTEQGMASEHFTERLGARLRRLSQAWRYFRGRGRMPGSNITFEEAARVDAMKLPDESTELITRYLTSRIASRMYFGQKAWGLPAIHGIRVTLVLASLVIWHAKVFAAEAGRSEVIHEDIRQAVMLTDHSFGHLGTINPGAAARALQTVNRADWPVRALMAVMY